MDDLTFQCRDVFFPFVHEILAVVDDPLSNNYTPDPLPLIIRESPVLKEVKSLDL